MTQAHRGTLSIRLGASHLPPGAQLEPIDETMQRLQQGVAKLPSGSSNSYGAATTLWFAWAAFESETATWWVLAG